MTLNFYNKVIIKCKKQLSGTNVAEINLLYTLF